MSGLSRAQSTRLISGYGKAGWVTSKPSLRPRFQRHYTVACIALPAGVDEAHERLSVLAKNRPAPRATTA